MPDYPDSFPLFPIIFDRIDPVMGSNFNLPYREIEAVCNELGTDPFTINDNVNPDPDAVEHVSDVLDMYANIIKNISGTTAWTEASIPTRRILAGSGNGGTVSGGTTSYLYPGLSGISATEYFMPLLWDGNAVKFSVVTQSSQSTTGSMIFVLRRQHDFDSGSNTAINVVLTAGAVAGTYSSTGMEAFVSDISRRPGTNYPGWTQEGIDAISILVTNNASTNSAAIAGWSIEYDQVIIGTQVPPST